MAQVMNKPSLSGVGGGPGTLVFNKALMTPWDDEPCLERCRSKQHGQKIWEISQGGSDESQVVCLWSKTCSNYSQVKDEFGRTALHAAASTGNLKAVEWLIKTQQCNVNAKDLISGYTALHRSIYFGQLHVARSLIQHGADVNLRDHEGLTPFELCQMDRPITFKQNSGDLTELTVWGSNANYNLGIGHQQPRTLPDVAPEFRRNEMSLSKVEMSTYHTLFLTQSGKVYACGYGMGGRLGTGDEGTVLSPSLVQLRNNGQCRDIAIGQDHSTFLTDTKVWTVGSNEFGQLGHSIQTTKLCNPRTVDTLQRYGISGILAGPSHSIFYNSQTVLVCGQNQGQFGRGFEEPIISPPAKLRLSLENVGNGEFTAVGGNEFCTALCFEAKSYEAADKQYIYVLRRHQYSRIDSINTTSQKILKIQASGEKDSSTLFMLTSSGRVLVWRESFNRTTKEWKGAFTRVVFSNSRLLDVKDFSVSLNSLVVITNTGEAYKAGWNCNNPPSIIGRMDERYGQKADADFQIAARQRRGKRDDETQSMALELMKIKRVPNVHTGLYVSSDPKGNNYAILQRHQMMDVTDIPYITDTTLMKDIMELYQEMAEDDGVSDMVFDLGGSEQYPAHRFIIASVAPTIGNVLKNSVNVSSIRVTDKLFGVDTGKCSSLENPKVFRSILDLIYKRHCSFTSAECMLEVIQCVKQDGKRNGYKHSEKWKELGKFRLLCRHLGLEAGDLIMQRFMHDLESQLEIAMKVDADNDSLNVSANPSRYLNGIPDMQFHREESDPSCDVVLECGDKVLFYVHKCVLVARLEYFKSMFSAHWASKPKGQTKMILPFSSKAVAILLECVYTNNTSLMKEADCELLGETIACADYVMNDRLLKLAESEMIRSITLKNVADILGFSWKHNGSQLKNTCFDFISLNLTAMLENRLLDNLPVEILTELSAYYRSVQRNNLLISRDLQKPRGVPDSEVYLEAIKQTPEEILEQLELIVETDGAMVLKKTQNKTPRSRVRLRSRTLSESDTVLECPEETYSTQHSESLRLSCSSNLDEIATPPGSPPIKLETPPATPPEKERRLVVPLPRNVIGIAMAVPPQKIQGSPIRFEEFPSLGACVLATTPPTTTTPNTRTNGITMSSPAEKGVQVLKPVQTPRPMAIQQPVTSTRQTPPSVSSAGGGSSKKKTKWRTLDSSADVAKQNQKSVATGSSPLEHKLTADGRDPTNPWKVNNKSSQVVFKAIVEDEVEKKRNFEKATSKPLTMMQIEDEAINFLTGRYTSEDTDDFIELLTVERVVTSNFSTPMWVQHPGSVVSSPRST